MTRNVLDQFECKKAKTGDILYNTDCIGNILLFALVGQLIIYDKKAAPVVEVDEGNFVLLPAEKCYIVCAATAAQTIFMHADSLSEMITEDPDWDPNHPVVLPIFPTLAHMLSLVESYKYERLSNLN